MSEIKNPLELVVTKNVVGVLETNITQLENYVNQKLTEYNPNQYKGDADSAKKDRAELNNAKKTLSQARINLMKELMKPYSDFETRCKNLEKKIDSASGQLDVIVKEKENEEKQKKKDFVIEIWKSKNFDLVSVEKIFNQKWLNKTAKEKDISDEMNSIIKKIYSELKIIERYEDSETLKAHYLLNLDLNETLAYGEELKETRRLAEEEAKNRDEREHNEKLEEQKKEVVEEALNIVRQESLSDLANQVLEVDSITTVKEYVFSIKATDEQLLRLKSACNDLCIEYNVEELTFCFNPLNQV